MFVQVVQGRVSDTGQVRAAYDQWYEEVSPGAAGWLGTTAGVSGAGDFIALTRFESALAARDNGRRPEHATWWERTAKLFAGEVRTAESSTAYEDRGGACDRAGFVQVIQRRVRDAARARQILTLLSPIVAAHRPEDLGTVIVEHDGGRFTVAVFFTSEREARGTERQPAPELKALRDEQNALGVEPPVFHDLREPWFYPPR
ncbi:MAG: hypothetical protein AUG44_14975 [Actinobacteria bacterium 13_1_20CM_3_71_11]|nr:MAG: hypothetical protein AUG44_14975 [Actinobacteria bacterium 13_1_20CM_3_71_11]